MIDKTRMLESLKAASLQLNEAEKIIDMKHGEGHAKAHPDLVSALMLTAALYLHAMQLIDEPY